VVARLVRLRQSGSQHEQQVSQRLLARLVGSGEPLLQREVERLSNPKRNLNLNLNPNPNLNLDLNLNFNTKVRLGDEERLLRGE